MNETSPDLDLPNSAIESAVTTQPGPPSSLAPRLRAGTIILGFATMLALAGVAALLFMTNGTLGELRDENRQMTGSIASLKAEIAALRADVASIPSGAVAQLPVPSDGASAVPGSVGEALAGLPRFTGDGVDDAVGLVINKISGLEYYTNQTTDVTVDDGKARAFFVWAHWCPYCQQEMPVVAEWVSAEAANHPNLEVVSITTAMDPTASNPLEPYLDDGQYPFPVLVDSDGSLSAQLGVNAFPFWVFTGPDGTVLQRHAGLLPEEALTSFFAQLNELGAEAAG